MTPRDKVIIANMVTNHLVGAPIDFHAVFISLSDEGLQTLLTIGGADAALASMAELEIARRARRISDWSVTPLDGGQLQLHAHDYVKRS